MPTPDSPRRAIYLDLDGTLLGPDRRIHPATLTTLHALVDRGVALGVATGRMHGSAAPHATAIRANAPSILFNGARIVDPRDGRVLMDAQISSATAQRALALARDHRVHVNLYAGETLCIERLTPTAEASMTKDGVRARIVGDLSRWLTGPVTKLLLIAPDAVLDELEAALAEQLGSAVGLVRPEATYLEVLPPGVSKGSALENIATMLGIPTDRMVVFGDGPNDLEMVEVAGIGIAMGNAHPTLQRVANQVIEHHDGDTIARTLTSIFTIEDAAPRDGAPEDPTG